MASEGLQEASSPGTWLDGHDKHTNVLIPQVSVRGRCLYTLVVQLGFKGDAWAVCPCLATGTCVYCVPITRDLPISSLP